MSEDSVVVSKAASKAAPRQYFIVNPAGAVHECDRDHARMRLRQVGYRMATPGEIKAYKAAPAHKGLGPVADRWTPEPDVEPEID